MGNSTRYRNILGFLFALFFLVNIAWLHRVPGLMGDEASEGQNVYELLEREGITITGERSYIGPLIDYVRVPFIWLFGYTALAVRVPMLVASLVTFWLAASVFRRWFGDQLSLFPLVAMAFSLPYLTHQRLGWAITLFPLFFFLILWLACLPDRQAQREGKYTWLWVGLAAGIGLHTHIMFAPTLVGLFAVALAGPVATGSLSALTQFRFPQLKAGAPRNSDRAELARRATRLGVATILLLVGFWAAFATQFVVLQLYTEDQGDPVAVGEVWTERLADLPSLLPLILSGSSYVAHYTGVEFSSAWAYGLAWVVGVFALVGVVLSWRMKVVWLWVGGMAVHLVALLYMIDRFSLRYFLMFVLGMYVLAGLGIGQVAVRVAKLLRRSWLIQMKAVKFALILSIMWIALVLVPFLRTGGGVAEFSLGNRVDSASALVDVRPLLACLRGAGSVSSENVHIYNRLLYVSHEYSDLEVITEEDAQSADLLVHYRLPTRPAIEVERELCPALTHFVVEQQN